jgi:RNA polymerase sigma factor (sigma-70 family)
MEKNSNDSLLIETFLEGIPPGFPQIEAWIDRVFRSPKWNPRISIPDAKQNCLQDLIHNFRTGQYAGRSLRGYVQRIAQIKCVAEWREIRKRRTTSLEDPDSVACEANPEKILIEKEEYETFEEVFDRLPPIDQRLLLMRVVDNLPYKEIAEELGLREVTAKVRFSRIPQKAIKLRRQIKKG